MCGSEPASVWGRGKRKGQGSRDRLKVSCLVVPPPRVGVGVSATFVSLLRELAVSAVAWVHDSDPSPCGDL